MCLYECLGGIGVCECAGGGVCVGMSVLESGGVHGVIFSPHTDCIQFN